MPISKIERAGMPGGAVLQVVQGTLNTSGSTASTSYIDVGLSASITPISTSSKILVVGHIHLNNGSQNGTYMRILRDATNIFVGTGTNAISDGTSGTVASTSGFLPNGTEGYQVVPCIVNYLDSPASTSTIIYKVQIRTGTGNTVYWNRQQSSGGGNPDFGYFASSLTLMEIAA